MPVDRAHAEHQLAGDGLVRGPGGDLSQHLELARGQAVRGAGVATRREPLQPLELRPGAEALEAGTGGVELERGRVVVAERPARLGGQSTRSCQLVGRVEPPPPLTGTAKRGGGRPCIAFRQLERAARLRRDRPERAAVVVPLRELVELVAGVARRLSIVHAPA